MHERVATATFELLRELYELAGSQRNSLTAAALPELLDLMYRRRRLMAELRELLVEGNEPPSNLSLFPSAELQDERHQDRIAIDALILGILSEDEQCLWFIDQKLGGEIADTPGLRRAA